MGTYVEASWDRRDDWLYDGWKPGWDRSSVGTNFLLDRVTAPTTPWIGGCGRWKTAWSSGVGLVSFTTKPLALDRGRKHRSSWAMQWKGTSVGLAATRIGPVRLTARNDAAGLLGEAFTLNVLVSGSSNRLVAGNLLNFDQSANSIDLNQYLNEWLVFDCSAESTGSAAPYTTKVYFDVWHLRAGRMRFLARLALPDYSGAVFEIDDWRFGYLLMQKGVDNVELLIDELRIDNGGGSVPLPRAPSYSHDAYQASVRIRKWDKVTSTWGSAWSIDPRAVSSLRCSFLAYRIEDSCELQLTDPGRYAATTLQDVLDDLDQNPKALYRLDVYAPDTTYADPQFPSTWRDDVIYWSGVLQRREPNREQGARGITLTAVGWTSFLQRMVVTKLGYHKQTVNFMLNDVLYNVAWGIANQWPGTLSLITRSNGLDSKLVVNDRQWEATTLDEVLQDLANLGQFSFGVSVCGWPSFDQSGGGEFRLVFFEPNAHVDAAVPAGAGLGEEAGIFFSIDDDRRIVEMQHAVDDSKYANRWFVVGDALFVDILSSIYVITGQFALDPYAAIASGDPGLSNFEGSRGLTGMELTFLDKAHRSHNFKDPETGDPFPAGWIGPLPNALRRLIDNATFRIIRQTFTGGGNPFVLYNLGEVPLDDESATLLTESLRYTVSGAGVPVERTVGDYEDSGSGATGREAVTRVLSSDQVRGWQGAGVLALQDRYADRMNAEQVKLRVKGWTRVPNGSRRQEYNLVALTFGGERTTLIGTSGAGGDGWIYGSDERPCGGARTFEIKAVSATFEDGGWDVEFSLGAAPRDLQAVLLPTSTEFRATAASGAP